MQGHQCQNRLPLSFQGLVKPIDQGKQRQEKVDKRVGQQCAGFFHPLLFLLLELWPTCLGLVAGVLSNLASLASQLEKDEEIDDENDCQDHIERDVERGEPHGRVF